MTRKRGLGKGLDALIPGDESFSDKGGILQILIKDITPNPRQPRAEFEPALLKELADSITEHGVLQPLVVTASPSGTGYQLIIGERRLQAAQMAGLDTVPVIVRQVDEQLQLILALIENLQRLDLNPLETAEGYHQLIEEFNLSHEAVATQVGKSRTAITNTLRLLNLAQPLQLALREGKISEGHARALLALSKAQAQNVALQTVLKEGLNVRQTEELVRRLSGERRKPTSPRKKSPDLSDVEEKLRQALGTRVTLSSSARGGRIIIHFYSDEELNALVDRLLDGKQE
ncbi:MAG: stage 0 sporulation protein J [Chloroflexi bacterium RBG_16_48_8]|nr:MAG: stage 0 sporulation protein J [Chloroflexi bacterium RBG_16_48_8]